MTIGWSPEARRAVAAALAKHPVRSGRCADAAREVLPFALQHDPVAQPNLVRPGPKAPRASYVLPRGVLPTPRWTHHVTVGVEAHCVDSLTGPDGTAREGYLTEHFQYAEYLEMADVDLAREDL